VNLVTSVIGRCTFVPSLKTITKFTFANGFGLGSALGIASVIITSGRFLTGTSSALEISPGVEAAVRLLPVLVERLRF